MTTCIDCHKKCHLSCANVTNDITYKCPQCEANRPNSPAPSSVSRCSARSCLSPSRKFQLQLQRLEEERALNLEFNREYLNKKYQLLEEAEVIDVSSNKSQSVHNWLQEIPDQQNL